MVILTVVPSEDDGGVPIYAYRVEYDQHVQDFKLGGYWSLCSEAMLHCGVLKYLVLMGGAAVV